MLIMRVSVNKFRNFLNLHPFFFSQDINTPCIIYIWKSFNEHIKLRIKFAQLRDEKWQACFGMNDSCPFPSKYAVMYNLWYLFCWMLLFSVISLENYKGIY